MAQKYINKLVFFALFFCIDNCISQYEFVEAEEHFIQELEDNLDAENFTYFRLMRNGPLRLELTSSKGDVDIYASSKSQYPSYDDYDLKSDSCGVDTVFVSESMLRPVYIALYGHPSFLHSRFRLRIFLSPQPIVESYEDLVAKYEKYYFDDVGKSKEKDNRRSNSESKKRNVNVEPDQPLWLKILIGFIEFVIEVIF